MTDRRGFKGLINTEDQRIVEKAFAVSGVDSDKVVETIRIQLLRVKEERVEEVALLRELEKRAMQGENVLLEYPKYRLINADEHWP